MFLLDSFNKKEDDFASLKEYNDYLEMVETISKLLFEVNGIRGTIFSVARQPNIYLTIPLPTSYLQFST